MPYGLDEATVKNLVMKMSSFPQIEKVVLYGSRAKGNFKPGSDIDLTVMGRSVTSEILYKLMDDIEELYLPYKVDISLFEHIDNKNLIEHINRVGVDFYRRTHEDNCG